MGVLAVYWGSSRGVIGVSYGGVIRVLAAPVGLCCKRKIPRWLKGGQVPIRGGSGAQYGVVKGPLWGGEVPIIRGSSAH